MTQALAKTEKEQSISVEDIDLIKKTVAAGASESEFRLFMYIAQRYTLDPLVKQIWLIKYGNSPAAIFTSRDGFLSIAHRSGQFDGMETTAVRNDKGQVIGAICKVWRRDMSHPFSVEVSRQEYDTSKGNWQKMPETMIKKVAESQCLRRAFDISGLYDPSEYDPSESAQAVQVDSNQPTPPNLPAQAQTAPKPVTPAPAAKPIPAQKEYRVEDDANFKTYSAKIHAAKNLVDLSAIGPEIGRQVVDQNVTKALRVEYRQRENELVDLVNSQIGTAVGVSK
jgi:phage recombination protein Bet